MTLWLLRTVLEFKKRNLQVLWDVLREPVSVYKKVDRYSNMGNISWDLLRWAWTSISSYGQSGILHISVTRQLPLIWFDFILCKLCTRELLLVNQLQLCLFAVQDHAQNTLEHLRLNHCLVSTSALNIWLPHKFSNYYVFLFPWRQCVLIMRPPLFHGHISTQFEVDLQRFYFIVYVMYVWRVLSINKSILYSAFSHVEIASVWHVI